MAFDAYLLNRNTFEQCHFFTDPNLPNANKQCANVDFAFASECIDSRSVSADKCRSLGCCYFGSNPSGYPKCVNKPPSGEYSLSSVFLLVKKFLRG